MLTDAGGQPRATDPRLVHLQQVLEGAEGVASVSPPSVNKTGGAAVFALTATTAPSDPVTSDLVTRLRTSVIPAATRGGRDRVRRRHHGRVRRPRDAHLRPAAAGDRRRPCPQLRRPAGGVPLGARAAQGDPLQPARRRRRVRRPDRVLPVGVGLAAHRPRRRDHRADRQLRPAHHVRGAVRHVDGLRGLPDQPDLPRPQRGHGHVHGRARGRGRQRARDHRRGRHHGHGVPELRHHRGSGAQGVRRGAVRRHPAGRDDRAPGHRPGDDGPAGRVELVAAALAAVAAQGGPAGRAGRSDCAVRPLARHRPAPAGD